jgi:hypothetical protein
VSVKSRGVVDVADVVDEEDAVDVADARRVSTRTYRVCDVGSVIGEYDECATASMVDRAG